MMTSGPRSGSNDGRNSGRAILLNCIDVIRRSVYFEHLFIAGADTSGDGPDHSAILYTDWPEELVGAYLGDGWARHDPVASAMTVKRGTVMPADILDHARDDGKAGEFLRLLRSFGVPLPVAIPVFHLQQICGTVAFSRSKPFGQEDVFFFNLISPALHREFAGDLRAGLENGVKLTRREVECLRHASTGMTSEEIAAVMPLAAATVTAQLRSAAAKLGAANRVSAIAEAIRRGIIE
jgi:DNA-binding CsgD family transcriptional regulator